MNLDEVIEYLTEKKKEHGGGVQVFINGEHGHEEVKETRKEYFCIGYAGITLGCDIEDIPKHIDKDDIVMQIGGY